MVRKQVHCLGWMHLEASFWWIDWLRKLLYCFLNTIKLQRMKRIHQWQLLNKTKTKIKNTCVCLTWQSQLILHFEKSISIIRVFDSRGKLVFLITSNSWLKITIGGECIFLKGRKVRFSHLIKYIFHVWLCTTNLEKNK